MKEVLLLGSKADDGEEPTAEDILDAMVASRRASANLSYFANTATPKTKILENQSFLSFRIRSLTFSADGTGQPG